MEHLQAECAMLSIFMLDLYLQLGISYITITKMFKFDFKINLKGNCI